MQKSIVILECQYYCFNNIWILANVSLQGIN